MFIQIILTYTTSETSYNCILPKIITNHSIKLVSVEMIQIQNITYYWFYKSNIIP